MCPPTKQQYKKVFIVKQSQNHNPITRFLHYLTRNQSKVTQNSIPRDRGVGSGLRLTGSWVLQIVEEGV
jgi:hypothetical protein